MPRIERSAWLSDLAGQIQRLVSSTGLGGDRLEPFPVARYGNDVDEAALQDALNEWVKTADRHHFVLLSADAQELRVESSVPPPTLPTVRLVNDGVAVVEVPGLSALDVVAPRRRSTLGRWLID